MRWSIRIARVAGIDVKIHLTFFLLLAWIGFAYYQQGGTPAAVEGLIFILLLFLSVLLHEFGHAFAARRYGVLTPDITLLPIGGVARLSRMPDEPRQELVIAIAGPAVNVVIAAVLFVVLGQMTDLSEVMRLDDPRVGMVAKLLSANVILVLFNLIPAFPMDGGRILRAALALRMNYIVATQIAARTGQAIAFVFGFIGLFANPLLIFIALFVYLGASQEAAAAEMRTVSERVPVAAAMVSDLRMLSPTATLADAADLLLRTSQHEFPIVDEEGRMLGLLTRDDLIAGLRRSGPATPAAEVMRRNLPMISHQQSVQEAFQLMQECGCPALPVTDSAGRMVGLLTPENVGEMMMVYGVLEPGQRPAWWAPAERPQTPQSSADVRHPFR